MIRQARVLLTHSPQVTWSEAWSKKSVASIFPGFGKNWQLSTASIIHPLLTLLASLTRQELARQVTCRLRAENQILRSELPERITLSNQERRKLVRHGKQLGARIKDLISIVSYSRFRKWGRQVDDGAAFCVVNERHLNHILCRAADWYNQRRCHSARKTCRQCGTRGNRRWSM